MNAYNELAAVNVGDHVEKKNGLSYLSWAWAWAELKKRYPMSFYTVYENRDGWNYHTDGRFCWVKTGVTLVDGESSLEHVEYLPVMDVRNKSIPANAVTSFDVNKAIQRSLTKAVARHGLGLYIYAGEDLPDTDDDKPAADKSNGNKPNVTVTRSDKVLDIMVSRNQRMKQMYADTGVTSDMVLMSRRRALVDGGIIPDKKISDMSDDEFDYMLSAFYANFPKEEYAT